MSRTPKAQALGVALRRVRTQAGLTTRELADRIGRNHGEISRWETGDRAPKPEHVAQILATLGIVGQPYDEVMSLAYDMTAPVWATSTLPAPLRRMALYIEMEQGAAEIVTVSPLLVPGLLQTHDYAEAIMFGGGLSVDEAMARVALRMGRREAMVRANPIQFTAYVGEAAIHQIIGDRMVMAGQLRHLLEMAKRPNIIVRVIPHNSGWQPALEGAFTLMQADGSSPVVHLELRKSGLILHQPDDVDAYQDAIDLVAQAALQPDTSARLIADAAHRMEGSQSRQAH